MTPEVAVIGMGNSAGSHDTYSAWAFGHPSDEAITLLTNPVYGITRTRTSVSKPVGIKGKFHSSTPPQWATWTIDRGIYGTGWDGTIVIHADDQGHFYVFTEHSSPETVAWGKDFARNLTVDAVTSKRPLGGGAEDDHV